MAREVDEERFADLGGVCLGLFQIEEPFEVVRQVEKVAVFGFLAVDGQQHARVAACRDRAGAFLSEHEVLRVQGRQVARKAFERGAPHAGNEVDDEREGDDRQRQASYAEVGHVAVVGELDFA